MELVEDRLAGSVERRDEDDELLKLDMNETLELSRAGLWSR